MRVRKEEEREQDRGRGRERRREGAGERAEGREGVRGEGKRVGERVVKSIGRA